MFRKPCPVCAERTVNPLVTLIAPRCKICKCRFRVRLPLGLGLVGHYLSRGVLLASVAMAVLQQSAQAFSIGLLAFAVLEVGMFFVGRLEPDRRDPITAMQLRRYGRQSER